VIGSASGEPPDYEDDRGLITLVGFFQVLLLFALVIFGLTHVFVAAMFFIA
jgi:hypothetical protein